MEQGTERLEFIVLDGDQEGKYDIVTLLNRERVIGVWRNRTQEETARLARLEHRVCTTEPQLRR